MEYSEVQEQAINKIVEWYKTPNSQQIYYLAGFAGTGKTTIVQGAIERIRQNSLHGLCVHTAAFTGKAAAMLAKRGVENPMTIHALIYIPYEDHKTKELKFMLSEHSPAHQTNLIVLDECFSRNTKIDTLNGFKYIQDIIPGDRILNALGSDTVVAVRKKEATNACQIKFNGKTITCSKNHRFFTCRGFVCASELKCDDVIIRQSEAVRLLQNDIFPETMDSSFLLASLQHEMVPPISRISKTVVYSRESKKMRRGAESIFDFRNCGSDPTNRKNSLFESDTRPKSPGKDSSITFNQRALSEYTRRQWAAFKYSATRFIGYVRERLEIRTLNIAWQTPEGISYALQSGYGESRVNDDYRSGWRKPQNNSRQTSRSEENSGLTGFRVENVEILELGDSRLDEFRESDGKLYLYDLQAKWHRTFTVEGALVHNCSMIHEQMAEDLLSFGKKILIMGDPGQLPPVSGDRWLADHKPDVFLTEIHRQAADSPILELATMARKGEHLPIGYKKGAVQVLKLNRENGELIHNPDTQVICGINRVRWRTTQMIRNKLGISGAIPLNGERVICCKNNHKKGFMNGQMGALLNIDTKFPQDNPQSKIRWYMLDVQFDDFPEPLHEISVDPINFSNHFSEGKSEKLPWKSDEFDWGYVITCHKAQGSQWPHVTVIDDSSSFKEKSSNWLYTALTRAEIGLTVLVREKN